MACQASAGGCGIAVGHCRWQGRLRQRLSFASLWSLWGQKEGGRPLPRGHSQPGPIPSGSGHGVCCQSLPKVSKASPALVSCAVSAFLPPSLPLHHTKCQEASAARHADSFIFPLLLGCASTSALPLGATVQGDSGLQGSRSDAAGLGKCTCKKGPAVVLRHEGHAGH